MVVCVSREQALAATGCVRLADFLGGRHFGSVDDVVAAARAAWWGDGRGAGRRDSTHHPSADEIASVVVGVPDWLEAFASHPRIGNKGDLVKASEREREASQAGGGGNSASERPMQSSSLSHAAAAAAEQAGAASSSQQTLAELARWNSLYERRFGHIFIVCASGRSGEEMLADLKRRYLNPPYAELAIAAEEHIRIAEKRLRGLFSGSSSSGGGGNGGRIGSPSPAEAAALRTGALASHLGAAAAAAKATPARPPITTHVLDTALGRPAAGVRVRLLSRPRGAPAGARAWVPAPGATTTDATSPSSPSPTTAAAATTDADGRCSALLAPGAPRPPPGVYRIEFDVGEYFERTAREVPGYGGGGVVAREEEEESGGGGGRGGGGRGGGGAFYPSAAVEFVISPPQGNSNNSGGVVSRPEHLHIPLTFSPFGYSTYRGS